MQPAVLKVALFGHLEALLQSAGGQADRCRRRMAALESKRWFAADREFHQAGDGILSSLTSNCLTPSINNTIYVPSFVRRTKRLSVSTCDNICSIGQCNALSRAAQD